MGTESFAIRNASRPLQAEFKGKAIVSYVANYVQLRTSFFGPFLCAISLRAPASAPAAPGAPHCVLPRLDVRSGSPIKMIIADFAGVPIRSSWRFVHLAAVHLAAHL